MKILTRKLIILPALIVIPLGVVSCSFTFNNVKKEAPKNQTTTPKPPVQPKQPVKPEVPKSVKTIDVNKLWIPKPTDTYNTIISQDPITYQPTYLHENTEQLDLNNVLVEGNIYDGWFEYQKEKAKLIGYTVEKATGQDFTSLWNGANIKLVYKTKVGYKFSNDKKEMTKEITLNNLAEGINSVDLFNDAPSIAQKAPWKQLNTDKQIKHIDGADYVHISLYYKGATYYRGLKSSSKPTKIKKYDGNNTLPGQNFWVELSQGHKNIIDWAGDLIWTATPNKGYYFKGNATQVQANFAFPTAWIMGK